VRIRTGRGALVRRIGARLAAERGLTTAPDAAADALELLGPGDAPLEGAPPAARVVLGWIGTHRDARAPELRAHWDLEEALRAGGVPVLALRLGPLVGAGSPLWAALRRAAPPPAVGRRWMHPLLEDDLVELLARVAATGVAATEWHEVAGREITSLDELAALARADAGPVTAAPAWEPALDVLREQRLVEPELWMRRFGVDAGSVTAWARRAAA
jgi:uncharacterized protein YbjT (DUF2867 family)